MWIFCCHLIEFPGVRLGNESFPVFFLSLTGHQGEKNTGTSMYVIRMARTINNWLILMARIISYFRRIVPGPARRRRIGRKSPSGSGRVLLDPRRRGVHRGTSWHEIYLEGPAATNTSRCRQSQAFRCPSCHSIWPRNVSTCELAGLGKRLQEIKAGYGLRDTAAPLEA